MKITKRQLKRIIREEYTRLKRHGLIRESWEGRIPPENKRWVRRDGIADPNKGMIAGGPEGFAEYESDAYEAGEKAGQEFSVQGMPEPELEMLDTMAAERYSAPADIQDWMDGFNEGYWEGV